MFMFSWRISDKSSLFTVRWTFKASCLETNFVSHTSQWYGIMLSCRMYDKSSLVFCLKLQSKLLKWSPQWHGIFSWRVFHIIVRCAIRCSFWQQTSKINKIGHRLEFSSEIPQEKKRGYLIAHLTMIWKTLQSSWKDTISLWTSF